MTRRKKKASNEEKVERPAAADESLKHLNPSEETDSPNEEAASTDDLLEDVRRSLMEEEKQQSATKTGSWWRRKKKEKDIEEEVQPRQIPTAELKPQTVVPISPAEKESLSEPATQEEALEEVIIDLKNEEEVLDQTVVSSRPAPESIEPKIDLDEQKKAAFQPRPAGEAQQDDHEIRSIALEGEEEVFVEVEAPKPDIRKERADAFQNALRPYRRLIFIGIAFLGALLAVIGAVIVFALYRQLRPAEVVEQDPNLPYPVCLTLPGGLNFNLERGSLKNGKWNPNGPEWLEGTEVCRWVAIPWSLQLEAVIRTLHPDDPIELTMSNNDRIVYSVYSVRQLGSEEMQELDENKPCLLLILSEPETELRWVLEALP